MFLYFIYFIYFLLLILVFLYFIIIFFWKKDNQGENWFEPATVRSQGKHQPDCATAATFTIPMQS